MTTTPRRPTSEASFQDGVVIQPRPREILRRRYDDDRDNYHGASYVHHSPAYTSSSSSSSSATLCGSTSDRQGYWRTARQTCLFAFLIVYVAFICELSYAWTVLFSVFFTRSADLDLKNWFINLENQKSPPNFRFSKGGNLSCNLIKITHIQTITVIFNVYTFFTD